MGYCMKRIGLLLALALALVSCTPAANLALGAVNAVGRSDDGTSLLVTTNGIAFQPVGLKESVVLSVVADKYVDEARQELAYFELQDSRCVRRDTKPEEDHRYVCKLGSLDADTFVLIKGVNRDALISWLQDGELAARFIVARE